MTWLALIQVLLKLVAGIVDYARDRQLIKAGEAQAIADNLSASIAIVDKARKARDAALDNFDKRGGVPDDTDPNLRD